MTVSHRARGCGLPLTVHGEPGLQLPGASRRVSLQLKMEKLYTNVGKTTRPLSPVPWRGVLEDGRRKVLEETSTVRGLRLHLPS
ncbi:hypothetical protein CapIbe_009965 [Capra ibex]